MTFNIINTNNDAPTRRYFVILEGDTGYAKGFYPSDIWPDPPQGSVEITYQQYSDYLEGESKGGVYRKRFVNGELVSGLPPIKEEDEE